MFQKSPENLFNAVFNVPQGAVMTLAVSFYQGITDPVSLLRMFVCAYCAGVMLTAFLRIPAAGDWVVRKLHCGGRRGLAYLLSGFSGGAIMGVLMNFFMTWMAIGPVAYFPAAFFHTLLFSIVVSGVSSCLWLGPVMGIVKRVYPR